MDDLATRLAAHPRYRWMPGMLAVPPSERRVLWSSLVVTSVVPSMGGTCLRHGLTVEVLATDWAPDLADPATAGCLRALLHEADPDVDMDWWAHRSEWQAWPPALDAQLPIAADPICGRCIAEALLAVWGPA